MHISRKFSLGILLVVMVIATAMIVNRARQPIPAPAVVPSESMSSVSNRPLVHVQRPAPEANMAEEPNHPFTSEIIPKEKLDEYLRLHNRNAASLLAVFHSKPLGEMSYLYEAATNFPNDPHVQWTVLSQNAFPEDRRKWLDAFKTASPSNSLANYLSAENYFKNNQTDAALKELLAANGKSQFNDFSMDNLLDTESLGQFSGVPDMETHVVSMAAMTSDLLPELGRLKQVINSIRDTQQQYQSSGDTASSQTLSEAGVGLAEHLMTGDSGKFLLNDLVGIASETIALQSLDQNAGYDFLGGKTPAQRLAELKQQRTSIIELNKNQINVLSLPPDQMAVYWERTKIYGEVEALRWFQQQNPTTPNSGN